LLTPPENVTTLTCELEKKLFFISLKVSCILSNVGGSEESQLWVVVGGSEKNPLFSPRRNKKLPEHVHINTRAPPVACPRHSTRAMQII